MGRLILIGVVVVGAVEVLMLVLRVRDVVPLAGGAAVAVVLWAFGVHLIESTIEHRTRLDDDARSANEALVRWRARTEIMVERADETRGDWDRHLRPMLAREFQMTTGHRLNKDPKAMAATGMLVFGADLWPWVNPTGASFADRDDPAPGGAALEEILTRLERL